MRRLLFPLMLAVAACEEPSLEEQPGEVVFEGDFVEFRVTDDAPEYCAGVPEYLDRYTGALYDELRVDPGEGLVSYSLVAPDDVRHEGEHFIAFASARGIVTGLPVYEHELVHAVQRRGYGRQYLLTEGLAELFGGDASTSDRTSTDGSAEELVGHVEEEGGIRGYAYGDAGRFVAFIDHRFGRGVLLRLLESTSRDDVSVEQFTSKVEDVTGSPWGDISREYDDSEVCEQHAYWNASPVCAAAEPLTLCEEAEDMRHLVALDCAVPDVLGERRDEFTEGEGREVWTYRTVTFEQAGGYAISIGGQWGEESVGYIELKSCRGGCGSFLQRFEVSRYAGFTYDFDIDEPGEYLLKVARPLDAPSVIEFFISGACE